VSRHEVRTVEKLETVAYYYLANTARLSSITSLKNKYDLATDQVRSYTEYLVECYLVGTLPRFSYKANIQQRSPHKVYATDLGIREAVAFRFSQDLGHLAETAVYNQLRRDPDSRLYYYQDTNSRTECDFVVWKGGEPHAVIQVCYTDDDQLPDREDHGLAVAMEQLDLDHGLLLTARQGARSRTLAGRTIVERSLWDWLLDGGTTV
jgi:hypothetical protein